ncbi:MAG: pantoate--beta-alanine ligase [Woeseiaceae bacterium]|nr:pantoate--beta-alanine ligase [Woeseiaceae bacterium]
MQVVHTKEELAEQIAEWRHNGDHVALVPTMGNIHAGHVALVELAREHAERVVVSIFVNPTQFGEGEDFDSYPRTLERDKRHLKKSAADLIFAPDVDTVYPFGIDNATVISVPGLTDEFCGAARPGHFDGVTSVVARLFAIVQPDAAVFGQKDYQQQLVIRHMTTDLSIPVQIITGETIRADDGLALSSRNSYLSDEERETAPLLHAALESIGQQLQNGKRDYGDLEASAIERLNGAGFSAEYVAIRRAENLDEPDRDCDELVVLAAAQLGPARLIDNIVVTI